MVGKIIIKNFIAHNVPQVAVRFWNYEKLNYLTIKIKAMKNKISNHNVSQNGGNLLLAVVKICQLKT